MSTQLQIVNRLLLRLREDQVTSIVDNDYAELVAEFVNAAIEEVVNHHDWKRYERYLFATVAADGNTSDVSRLVADGGGVEEGDVMNDQSRLTWSNHDIAQAIFSPVPYASVESDNTLWARLVPSSHQEQRIRRLFEGGTGADQIKNQYAEWFDIRYKATDRDAPELVIYPYAKQDSTVVMHHWTPPAVLSLTGSDDGTELEVPEKPVFEFALMMALNERGEEIGEPGNVAEQRYYRALSRAVEKDIALDERNNEFEWRRD